MDTFRADVKKLLSEGAKPAESEKKKYYRVQIGAYSVKANAEAQLAKAKKLALLKPILSMINEQQILMTRGV